MKTEKNISIFMDDDCGQDNSLMRLLQHATQDLTYQENVGVQFTTWNELNGTMSPQSFRMNDLIMELNNINPLRNDANQLETQNYQEKNENIWRELKAIDAENTKTFDDESFQTISFPFDEALLFHNLFPFYLQNIFLPPMQFQVNSIPNQYNQYLTDSRDDKCIEIEEELNDLEETEDSFGEQLDFEQMTDLEEERDENEYSDEEGEPIVEFDNTRKFCNFLQTQARKKQKCECKSGSPKKELKQISKTSLLDNKKRYTHIERNPYKNKSNPYGEGILALQTNVFKAVLYFDEAARQDNMNARNWIELSYALYLSEKYEESLLAAKEHLRLDPGSYRGNLISSYIYDICGCKYQACRSIFNWLKFNNSYNFLIPEDFEMNDDNNDITELYVDQFESVKELFFKAARENPINIDARLQIVISELFELTGDHFKIIDCLRAALNADPNLCIEWINLGSTLFQVGQPYKALDAYSKAAEFAKNRIEAYEGLGIVYMYLQNYKESIRCFKTALGQDYNSIIEKHSLKAQYNLCLRLYIELSDLPNV